MDRDDPGLRLLWISHLVPYPPKGGALQRSFNLLREVSRYHTVDLIAFVQRPFLKYLDHDDERALDIARTELKRFCRTVHFEPLPQEMNLTGRLGLLAASLLRTTPYTVNWLKSDRMAKRIREQVTLNEYDAAHIDTISLLEYRSELGTTPVLLNHHNVESHMMFRRAKNELNPFGRFYMWQEGYKLRRYETIKSTSVDLHVTCSKLDSTRLIDILPSSNGKVAEIPNGVDVGYFKPSFRKTDGRRLLFAGRLGAYANRRAALYIGTELWPRLSALYPDISLDVIGADPPKELIELSEKEPNVHVHGFVNDVRPYFEKASVYVCPITDGGGTKLKVLDALAMGKALVADPIACEGIAVTDGVDVSLAQTADQYVEKIVRLLDDESARVDMGRAGRRLVEEKYSYSAIGRKLASCYEWIVRNRREQTTAPPDLKPLMER